jgi:prophage antirepressor-like protein
VAFAEWAAGALSNYRQEAAVDIGVEPVEMSSAENSPVMAPETIAPAIGQSIAEGIAQAETGESSVTATGDSAALERGARSTIDYQGNLIRTIEDKRGNLWFVAKDVCQAMGYRNHRSAVEKHCLKDGISKCNAITSGGSQALTHISWANVLRLTIRSNKRSVEPFLAWITDVFKDSPAVQAQECADMVMPPESVDSAATTVEGVARADLSSIFAFYGSSIRTYVDEKGMVWFAGVDVCAVLGYANPSKSIADHCRNDGLTKRYTVATPRGEQELTYLNEPNLYRLIIRSRKPEAQVFEQWLMEEVLPTLRRTGQYQCGAPAEPVAKPLPSPAPRIPRTFAEIEASILARTRVSSEGGVMGPYFSLEKGRVNFDGKDMGKIVRQLNQAVRLAKVLGKLTGVEDSETILSTAINTMLNVEDVDVYLMTHGRPFYIKDVADDFMSPTALGRHFGFSMAPATAVNKCLEEMGYQVCGSGMVLFVPTPKGRAYATFRSFAVNDRESRVHLFWRPSIIPLLEAFIHGEATTG